MRPAPPRTVARVRVLAQVFAVHFLTLVGDDPDAEDNCEAKSRDACNGERGKPVRVHDRYGRGVGMRARSRAREAEQDGNASQKEQQAGDRDDAKPSGFIKTHDSPR